MNQLKKYGADDRFFSEAARYPDLYMGRVTSQYKDLYKVITEKEECLAELSGKLRHETNGQEWLPVVGDFVMLDRETGEEGNGIIHATLTRKSAFERSAAGTANRIQVVASNIDLVFICMSLNNDYNLSRLERYLSVAWESRATPVVLLTKSDLCRELELVLSQVVAVAVGVDVIVTSSYDSDSHSEIMTKYLKEGVTASFVGSSGVGKSTLVNCLAGKELLATSQVRQDDDKGHHTTTRRELVLLPQGGVVIDTPGMRELGLEVADLETSFADIEELASRCRFRDCSHGSEPGCAVRVGIETGELEVRRFENYLKLQKEAGYVGLSSREIEEEKLNAMFQQVGGIKNARKFIKEKKKGRL